jgi:hypothetical protein
MAMHLSEFIEFVAFIGFVELKRIKDKGKRIKASGREAGY